MEYHIVQTESRQRPYKVWSYDRQTRKAVMASNLWELRERGSSRLGFPATDVKIVLESDGTEVEDDIYFQTINRDTIFLILCPGERWLPPGVEALRARRNMGVSEDGWIPTSKTNKGSYSVVDPSKLKFTKPDEVDSIRLGPGGRGPQSWGKGSSGGNRTPADSDVKTALTNRYSALADQALTPSSENRRGSQRSVASSCESSHGRNCQLPPAARKTPPNSRERENLRETIKELNRNMVAETTVQEKKNESQLNGKAVATMAALSLKGPELSEDVIDKKTKPLIDEFLHNADFEKLDFMVNLNKAVPKPELTIEEIKTKLRELLQNKENEEIFDWIDTEVGPSVTNNDDCLFIRALAYEVHKSCLTGTGAKCELNQALFKKRITVMNRYIDHDEKRELQTLFEVQKLINEQNQTKGVLRQIFDILYDDDVISEETFKNWEQSKDPNELEGKGVALLSTRGFFTWLRDAESVEDVNYEDE